MFIRLAWDSQRSTCLSLWSAGIKDVHDRLSYFFACLSVLMTECAHPSTTTELNPSSRLYQYFHETVKRTNLFNFLLSSNCPILVLFPISHHWERELAFPDSGFCIWYHHCLFIHGAFATTRQHPRHLWLVDLCIIHSIFQTLPSPFQKEPFHPGLLKAPVSYFLSNREKGPPSWRVSTIFGGIFSE